MKTLLTSWLFCSLTLLTGCASDQPQTTTTTTATEETTVQPANPTTTTTTEQTMAPVSQ